MNQQCRFGIKQTIFAIAAAAMAISAQAAVISVTPGSTLWVNPPGENGSDGKGSSTISATMAHAGNGSLELAGDRTRMVMGSLYTTPTSLGLLDDLSRLTFDWAIAGDSVSALNKDYTPALRVSVVDNGKRYELVWEGVYNGTYGKTERDTWYSAGIGDVFYRYDASAKDVTKAGTSQVNMTLAGWESSNYFTDAAYIIGFSVGAGSPAGANYHAFADNVTIGMRNGSETIYNFEARGADVPEPGSLALLGLGLAAAAAASRKRRAR